MVALLDYALLLFASGVEVAASPTEEAPRVEDGPLVQLARQVEAIGSSVEASTVLLASLSLNVLLLLLFSCAVLRRKPPKAAVLPPSPNILDAAEAQRRVRKAERSAASKPVIGSLVGAVSDLKRLYEDYKFLAAGELLDALRVALMNAASGGWGSWGR